jgi:Terminase large subunit, T4likevirus-type, N-terminal
MAKWIQLPSEPLFYQKDQYEFLEIRKRRICRNGHGPYTVSTDAQIYDCPTCHVKGIREWDRLLIIAGRRWGKSKAGSIALVDEACIPNSIVWACAPTNPKLHRYVIPAIQQLIPEDWVEDWNSEFKDLRLKNGSLIHFQTLEDPDQGRGQGLDALWIDEVCELSKAHWDVIRPSLAGDTVAFFTTSPRSYDWVYTELYKPAAEGVPGHWACHAPTSSSANPRVNPEFLARERTQMSDLMYKQEYEADFVTFQGAIYGGSIDPQILDTDEEIRKIIPEWDGSASSIEGWRQVLIGIDTGADHPFGAVKLLSTERGMVVVGEYLERNKAFVQHANSLKRLAWPANPKWAINKNEKQQSLELAQHGIYCQKAENEQIAGIERVKTWLQCKQLWFIKRLCPNTIRQMTSYRWSDSEATDGSLRKEKVYKLEDELPDCIRYALMTWPTLPTAPPEQETPPRDLSAFSGEIQASIQRLRRIEGRKPSKQDVVNDFWQ